MYGFYGRLQIPLQWPIMAKRWQSDGDRCLNILISQRYTLAFEFAGNKIVLSSTLMRLGSDRFNVCVWVWICARIAAFTFNGINLYPFIFEKKKIVFKVFPHTNKLVYGCTWCRTLNPYKCYAVNKKKRKLKKPIEHEKHGKLFPLHFCDAENRAQTNMPSDRLYS